MKSQAAMEYLMTYGWAILVIAVVLAALYSLGIFNPNTFAPKASAGSCEVVRPFGPTTTTDVHLEGTCTNMIPKYVMVGGPNPSSHIIVNDTSFNDTFKSTNSLTLSTWEYELPNSECEVSMSNIFPMNSGLPGFIFRFGVSGGGWAPNRVLLELFTPTVQTNMFSTKTLSYNVWNNIAASYNGSIVKFYINGNPAGNLSYNGILSSGPNSVLAIGSNFNSGCYSYFPGYISNFQIYNKALSANQISALYQEGIGGAPIELTHLVAWYPLNGNANDYSGNDYNGKEYDVAYSSTWYRTYSAP